MARTSKQESFTEAIPGESALESCWRLAKIEPMGAAAVDAAGAIERNIGELKARLAATQPHRQEDIGRLETAIASQVKRLGEMRQQASEYTPARRRDWLISFCGNLPALEARKSGFAARLNELLEGKYENTLSMSEAKELRDLSKELSDINSQTRIIDRVQPEIATCAPPQFLLALRQATESLAALSSPALTPLASRYPELPQALAWARQRVETFKPVLQTGTWSELVSLAAESN